jgi:hypothetical protein
LENGITGSANRIELMARTTVVESSRYFARYRQARALGIRTNMLTNDAGNQPRLVEVAGLREARECIGRIGADRNATFPISGNVKT